MDAQMTCINKYGASVQTELQVAKQQEYMNSQEANDPIFMQMSSALLGRNWQSQLAEIQDTFSYYLLYLKIVLKLRRA